MIAQQIPQQQQNIAGMRAGMGVPVQPQPQVMQAAAPPVAQPAAQPMPAQNNMAQPVMPVNAAQMMAQPGAAPQPVAMPARPVFQPGQIPNVNAPGMPQPGGFAQSPMVQNFMRQRMGMQ